jgi:molecular chaperone GrpE (heat shock protein)
MKKTKLKGDIHKIVSELELTIKTLKQQSETQKQLWKETQKQNHFDKHMAIEKGISELNPVIQSLANAYNWATRIGE